MESCGALNAEESDDDDDDDDVDDSSCEKVRLEQHEICAVVDLPLHWSTHLDFQVHTQRYFFCC